MVRIFKQYVPVVLLCLGAVELLIVVLSIYAGIFIRYVLGADQPWGFVTYLQETMTFAGVLGVAMFAMGLYQREFIRDLRTTFVRLATSFAVAFLGLSLVFYVFPDLKIWRSALAIAILLAVAGILATRFIVVRATNIDRLKRRVLVLGAGARAARIEALDQNGNTSFVSVGYVPIDGSDAAVSPERVVGRVDLLGALVRQQSVDEIVIAAEDRRGNLPNQTLLECKLNGVTITPYATFWERETGRVELDALDPSWLIYSDGFGESPVQAIAKRLFDVSVSLALLLFALPLLVVAAVAIRLESPGAVLYRQERVGRRGRPFRLLKFRSMRHDAEPDGVPKWAAEHDPRVTRVGAFIRKTRIDEIPQILNVLKGDMSFVGPRPERPYFVEELGKEIPFYNERHRVKPGITGWAQLSYSYGASVEDAKRKLGYDLYYLKNFSILFDLIILVQTIRVVLWPESARAICAPEAAGATAEVKTRPAA
ncbi:MAG: TIGR03013 family XrtA/PEP-CTERM system glycosyltransferase [Alphaproteobacteria bacterium]